MFIINAVSLDITNPIVNATSSYAKLDLEPWYSFLSVSMEAGNSISDSARNAKERAGSSIN